MCMVGRVGEVVRIGTSEKIKANKVRIRVWIMLRLITKQTKNSLILSPLKAT